MKGEQVFVVGGGNSAGQGAVDLARYAAQVTLLVRGPSLAETMSDHLVRELEATANVTVRYNTEAVAGHGDGRLRGQPSRGVRNRRRPPWVHQAGRLRGRGGLGRHLGDPPVLEPGIVAATSGCAGWSPAGHPARSSSTRCSAPSGARRSIPITPAAPRRRWHASPARVHPPAPPDRPAAGRGDRGRVRPGGARWAGGHSRVFPCGVTLAAGGRSCGVRTGGVRWVGRAVGGWGRRVGEGPRCRRGRAGRGAGGRFGCTRRGRRGGAGRVRAPPALTGGA
jgi:hypothetical protein